MMNRIEKSKTPATMIVLKGYNVPGVADNGHKTVTKYVEIYFTASERKTAIAIAKKWDNQGCRPYCYSKNYSGKVQTLYNYRTRQQKKAA